LWTTWFNLANVPSHVWISLTNLFTSFVQRTTAKSEPKEKALTARVVRMEERAAGNPKPSSKVRDE
jgi:hypothetical protein